MNDSVKVEKRDEVPSGKATPNKYHKSIIYKLEHVTNPELIYVGGTTNFSARKAQHKSRTLNPNDKEHNGHKYKMIRANGGWESFNMIPIREISVETKRQLEIEEEKVREECKQKRANMLNSQRAFANETPAVKSKEAAINAVLNADDKLREYRKKNSETIKQYKEEKKMRKKRSQSNQPM